MMRHVVLIVCALLLGGVAVGRKTVTTRHKLRAVPAVEVTDTARGEMTRILVLADTSAVVASGFDKPLGSLNETMFVSNRLGTDVTAVYFTLDYLDRHGRQLHRASRRVETVIPPGETRQLIFPSWDRQKSFYYISGRKPRTMATPFSVDCRIDSVEIIPEQ